MIKKVAAIQTSDGTLFLEPADARQHEFALQLRQLFGIKEDVSPATEVISIVDLVEKMDDVAKAYKEATEIVEGAKAL